MLTTSSKLKHRLFDFDRYDRYIPFLGVLYIWLIPIDINVKGQFFVHDILVPFMGLLLIPTMFQKWGLFLRTPSIFFLLFILLAGFLTVYRYHSLLDLYEFSIYLYVIIVFLFFYFFPLTRKQLIYYGIVILLAMLLSFLLVYMPDPPVSMPSYEHSTISFLTTRFRFTFGHPNMLGSFFVLPITCLLLGIFRYSRTWSPVQLVLFSGVLIFSCLPLFFAVSRDMLLTIAVIFGWFLSHPQLPYRKVAIPLLVVAFCLIFVIFYLTVIFPFFPVKDSFPYINTDSYGMYMMNHIIYFRIVVVDAWSFVLGLGKSNVVERFGEFTDIAEMTKILGQYNMAETVTARSIYHDAHNEYLNLITNYGVVATILLYFGIVTSPRLLNSSLNNNGIFIILVFLIVAILCVSLWRDILSKRWIWITLAIIISSANQFEKETNHAVNKV